MKIPRLYIARFRDGSLAIPRPELNETLPPHADMCRYDIAFVHPADCSLIIFPVFGSRGRGNTSSSITHARWRSCGLEVEPLSGEYHVTDTMSFMTYRNTGNHELRTQTLFEFLQEHQYQIASWR